MLPHTISRCNVIFIVPNATPVHFVCTPECPTPLPPAGEALLPKSNTDYPITMNSLSSSHFILLFSTICVFTHILRDTFFLFLHFSETKPQITKNVWPGFLHMKIKEIPMNEIETKTTKTEWQPTYGLFVFGMTWPFYSEKQKRSSWMNIPICRISMKSYTYDSVTGARGCVEKWKKRPTQIYNINRYAVSSQLE